MLKISRKFEYGLHAIVYLASRSAEEVVTVKQMASDIGFSQEFMAKALQSLKKAGLAESIQGVKGGYRIGRAPEEITVADVGRAIEGEPHLMKCSVERDSCEIVETCPYKGYMFRLEKRIDGLLGETTIASLIPSAHA